MILRVQEFKQKKSSSEVKNITNIQYGHHFHINELHSTLQMFGMCSDY